MGDNGIPDSVSSDQLRSLLNQNRSARMPLSDVIPTLEFGGGTGAEGGICDLQFVVMQIINQSASGINLMQEFTAAMYLLHSVGDSLQKHVHALAENAAEYGEFAANDKAAAIAALTQIRFSHESLIQHAEQLHTILAVSACQDRADNIRHELGSQATDHAIRSRLMLSDLLLRDLHLTREQADAFVTGVTDSRP